MLKPRLNIISFFFFWCRIFSEQICVDYGTNFFRKNSWTNFFLNKFLWWCLIWVALEHHQEQIAWTPSSGLLWNIINILSLPDVQIPKKKHLEHHHHIAWTPSSGLQRYVGLGCSGTTSGTPTYLCSSNLYLAHQMFVWVTKKKLLEHHHIFFWLIWVAPSLLLLQLSSSSSCWY